jgi:thiol-disulfide isomerase/thioredoxin
MSIQHLTSNHFYIDTGKKGKVLCTTQKDIIFVFFHLNGDQCENCHKMMPAFKELQNKIPAIKYAAVNLSEYPDVAKKSLQTIAPITYVPYLIVYINSRPFLRYDGGQTVQDMTSFLNDLLNRIPKETKFINGSSTNNSKFDNEVPAFPGGGIPYNVVCDKNTGVCYLSFEDLKKSK